VSVQRFFIICQGCRRPLALTSLTPGASGAEVGQCELPFLPCCEVSGWLRFRRSAPARTFTSSFRTSPYLALTTEPRRLLATGVICLVPMSRADAHAMSFGVTDVRRPAYSSLRLAD
jgi:LSD1 subclass zinc finger protein